MSPSHPRIDGPRAAGSEIAVKFDLEISVKLAQQKPAKSDRSHRLLAVRVQVFALLAMLLSLHATVADASELRRTPVVRAVQKNRDAIVNIRGQKTIKSASNGIDSSGARRVNGMGTGVIIDPRGYIVTNHHVVEGVSNVQVTLANREKYRARLISHDIRTDLALIKINPRSTKLPVITLGTSSDLMPGEPVIAVGNAFGYENTVTTGIISALHREVQVSEQQAYDNLIQTDASINPGNSGGPLLNIDGQMIGLNAAVRVGAQGIGFALPIDDVLKVTSRLISVKRVDHNWHGVVSSGEVRADGEGVVVRRVEPGSPAAKIGVQAGDVITQVGKKPIRNAIDLERMLLGRTAGDSVSIAFRRDNAMKKSNIVLETYAGRVVQPEMGDSWERVGLRFEAMPSADVRAVSDRYRGGLRVTEVRSDSPADRQGIKRGDILVGMHIWETVTEENVDYVLKHKDFQEFSPLKFYVLRGEQTLYGHLRLASSKK